MTFGTVKMPSSPVIVFGVGRSGTTLVREILNRSSWIHIAPEIGFFDRLYGGRKYLSSFRPSRTARRWVRAMIHKSHDPSMAALRRFTVEIEQFVVEREGTTSATDIYRLVLDWIARKVDKEQIGEKTPNYVNHVRLIQRLLPESRLVACIRDPRAVVASMLARPDLGDSIARKTAEWRRTARDLEHLGSGVHIVRYESLVMEPVREVRNLAEYLGGIFEDDMVKGLPTNSSYSAGEPGEGGISTKSVDRWQRELSGKQLRSIEAIAGPDMERWGYQPVTGGGKGWWRTVSRASAAMFDGAWKLEKALHRVGLRPFRGRKWD